MAFEEKQKITEQKLLFSKRCKAFHIIPNSIKNNIRINSTVLFPNGEPAPNPLAPNLYFHSSILEYYNLIRQTKYRIINTGIESVLNNTQFSNVIQLLETNNNYVKSHYKQQVIRRFSLLSVSSYSVNATTGIVSIDPHVSRVTTLGTDITEHEEQLLSLSPNFALSARVDEKLLDTVRIIIAHTAYKLPWKIHLNTLHRTPSFYQHFKNSVHTLALELLTLCGVF